MTNSVTVTSGNIQSNVNTVNNAAWHWSEIAKQWAISQSLVEGTDYSSKYYANVSKGYYELLSPITEDLTNINLVAADLTNIDDVAGSITNINSVAADLTNIDSVIDNMSDIEDVVANMSDINSVASNTSNINAVADNATNINAVGGSISNVNSVANDLTNINAVAADLTNIDSASSNASLAKDWANKMDGTVDGTEYSAKYYAQQASQAQVQANWNETDTTSKSYIQNKPTNLQTTSNLVTSVSSSSTDSQYPSAKLFYDTVGNIETLLQAV